MTGAAGMLGSAIVRRAPAHHQMMAITRADGDLTQRHVAERMVSDLSPRAVIHCAAYADVDGCTADPQRAQANNTEATRLLAQACSWHDIRMLYVSTDYVFSGTKSQPYKPDDEPDPINAYGESKLGGEQAVADQLEDYLIVRTQWLYGAGGKNFVTGVVERARSGQPLKVVRDELGSPTYVYDLAGALWLAVEAKLFGIVHVTNSGHCSRLELAREALKLAGVGHVQMEPISSEQWPSPTRRPLHAILDNSRWVQAGYPPLRPWKQALTDFARTYLAS